MFGQPIITCQKPVFGGFLSQLQEDEFSSESSDSEEEEVESSEEEVIAPKKDKRLPKKEIKVWNGSTKLDKKVLKPKKNVDDR